MHSLRARRKQHIQLKLVKPEDTQPNALERVLVAPSAHRGPVRPRQTKQTQSELQRSHQRSLQDTTAFNQSRGGTCRTAECGGEDIPAESPSPSLALLAVPLPA